MNKKIRIVLTILAIPIIMLTLIQSDFKNFKSSSKRIAEEINTYYSSKIERDIKYHEKSINEINDLHLFNLKYHFKHLSFVHTLCIFFYLIIEK